MIRDKEEMQKIADATPFEKAGMERQIETLQTDRQGLLKTIDEKQKIIDKIDADYSELVQENEDLIQKTQYVPNVVKERDELKQQLSDAQKDIDCLKQSAAHYQQLYQSAKSGEIRQNKLVVAAEAYIVALLSPSE